MLIAVATACHAFAAEDDDLSRRIVGAWGETPGCADGMLAFAADGTFSYADPGGYTLSGTWNIEDGILHGTWDDGTPQPDATVAFGPNDATLEMSVPEGGPAGTYHRCEDPGQPAGSST
jgi:hypothetical protein